MEEDGDCTYMSTLSHAVTYERKITGKFIQAREKKIEERLAAFLIVVKALALAHPLLFLNSGVLVTFIN